MLRLISDEDVNGDVVRGLRRHRPTLDLVRAVDVGLKETPDPDVLQWAAAANRVLLTEDVNTMVGYAWDRVRAGQPMPGVIALTEGLGIGQAIDDVLTVADCYSEEEIRNQVVYIPLR